MSSDLWGRLASTYDEDHTYISGADLVAAIRTELAAAVPAGEVVELGCGTGLYTRAYASGCERVVATDLSGPMVEAATRALADLPNVTVQRADAVATGLPDAGADGVVMVNLLHIVADAAAVLTEARRLLRPGGALVVIDATATGLSVWQLLASIRRVLGRWGFPRAPRGSHNIDQGALEKLVREAGFGSLSGHALTGAGMNAAFVRAVREPEAA